MNPPSPGVIRKHYEIIRRRSGLPKLAKEIGAVRVHNRGGSKKLIPEDLLRVSYGLPSKKK